MKTRESPLRMVWAEVDLGALRKNLRAIRSALRKERADILAVVKADAYGHGLHPVASVLAEEGVDFFGVANIGEAVELRKVLKRQKILVLGSFHKEEIPLYLRCRVTPTISSLEDLRLLEKICRKKSLRFPVHVKVDTGMGRLGVWHAETRHFFEAARKCRFVFIDGLYTHFSSADRHEGFTKRQIRLFQASLDRLESFGIRPQYVHAANSTALVCFRQARFNLVRPGILLYGISPSNPNGLPIPLRPVLKWKTRISFLKKVEKGRTISYGATYRTPKNTTLAVLPVGYSHGYRVSFSNKSFVLVRGILCPVVGRVTMDQTLVDVGKVPSVKRWEEVTLIGKDRGAQISAERLARLAQTIPYEIICSLHSRIPRIYKNSR